MERRKLELKKKAIVLSTVLTLGIGSVFAIPTTYAESLSDLKDKKESISEKRSGVKADITDTEKKIEKLQSQQLTVEEQIDEIEKKLTDTTNKINEKNKEIQATETEIKKLKAEIAVLKERIEKRNEVLKDRAVSYQETGGNFNFIQIIFGSSSFGDLIERVSAVATIAEADREILNQHEADKKEVEMKQASVEEKLADLKNMKAELEKMQNEQKEQKKQKNALMEQLKHKEKHAHELKMSLEEEEANLAAQEKAIQSAIHLEERRLAELEAARKKAAEEAKQEAKRAAASGGSGSSGGESPAPPISSGMFTNPSAGVVTSKMGQRWNRQHAGIDIAKSGKVPIVAAADGVVSRSYYSSSYGNVIFISHSINGQLYTTVYAHLSSRLASANQVVAKGQKIGYMGNTGRSYGQHLHFEIHKGPWNVSKSNAVNPLDYVSY